MAEIDDLLSATLKRVAQPGDPAGVADAISARVAAGDTGTPASSSGFGGLLPAVSRWLPWIGVIVVAGLIGGTMGATGVFGREVNETVVVGYTSVLDTTAEIHGCPGGPVIGTLVAGTRVLAIERSEDGAHLGIRNPDDFARTAWLPVGDLVVDAGQAEIASLPAGAGCAEAALADPVPVPVPTGEPVPVPKPGPGPAPDTSGPALASASAKPNPISMNGFPECGPTQSVVSVIASDPSGVQAVLATWSGGSAGLASSGSTWSFAFSEDTVGFNDTNYTITLTAVDGAGNSSSTAVSVTVLYCLI